MVLSYFWKKALFCLSFLSLGILLFFSPIFYDIGFPTLSGLSFLVLFLVLLLLQLILSSSDESAKTSMSITFFAVLAGLASMLRLLPLPMGASAFFFLPLLVAHVFGPTFGTVNAALSMLVSAFLGSGMGPWMPYQVAACGLMGMIAGCTKHRSKYVLIAVSVIAGFAYGILMNVWFWPSMSETEPGGFWAFYLATSIWWDACRAVTNVVFISIFYDALVRVLKRYQRRMA